VPDPEELEYAFRNTPYDSEEHILAYEQAEDALHT
jgi:hypothetical protein